jgi:hypothetical protein
VQVATSSRWVPYGYNHLVAVTNGCSKQADCEVSTDVNPQVQKMTIAPSDTAVVTTFLGAASATFLARVSCRLP